MPQALSLLSPFPRSRWPAALALAAAAALLAACGGGRSDWRADTEATVTDTSVAIAGTVAAGAPMMGTVEALDNHGVRKQALIGADGSYRLGLKGLTLPLLLRASGHVGGHRQVLLSAVTAEDVGGTVNVTPLTDLILANIAGGDPQAFYAQPDFTRLTAAFLDQARVMLTLRLAPVLTELGVDTGFDLRRSAFQADHTRVDAVLDLIRVRVDGAARRATLSDVVSGASVSDDLTDLNDRQPLPAPAAGAYAGAVADLQAVAAVLARLNALFASAVPAADSAELLALFDPALRHSGLDLDRLLASDRLRSPGNVGVQLLNPVIVERAADGQRMRVRVQVLDTLGQVIAYDQVDSDEFELRRDAGGAWRIAGDRRMGDVALSAVATLDIAGSGRRVTRSLQFWLPAANAAVAYVGFSGAGLPGPRSVAGLGTVSGALLQRAADGRFGLLDDAGQWHEQVALPDCTEAGTLALCADLSLVAAEAAYTVTFYASDLRVLGEVTRVRLPAPPLAPAEALAQAGRWFAQPKAATPASFSALSEASPPRLAWTLPGDSAWVPLALGWQSGTQSGAQALAARQTSATLSDWRGGAPAEAPLLWLWLAGPGDRELAVRWRWAS